MGSRESGHGEAPLVSIGLPVFNGASSIARSIESLLGQTEHRIELIISDNASTDETRQICEHFASQDDRVRYFPQKENRGAWWNFHFVLQQARGQYFMWAAHDDYWDRGWIAGLLPSFTGVVATVYGVIVGVDDHGSTLGRIGDFKLHRDPARRMLRYYLVEEAAGKANLIYGIHRTEFAKKCVFETDRAGTDGEDMHFVFQILAYGEFRHMPEVSMYKHVRQDFNSRSIGHTLRALLLARQTKCYLGYIRVCDRLGLRMVLVCLLPLKYLQGILFAIYARLARLGILRRN